MRLSAKEREAVGMLRELDVHQRDKMLGEMRRTVMANRITAKIAGKKVKTVADHKIVGAYGKVPPHQRIK